MKTLFKILALAIVLATSAPFALASTLTGTIGMAGQDTFTTSGGAITGITFSSSYTTATVIDSTGYLSHYPAFSHINMVDLAFSSISGNPLLFYATDPNTNKVIGFFVTSLLQATTGNIKLLGVLAEKTIGQPDSTAIMTISEFDLTNLNNTNSGLFVADVTTAPEPSSLVLLGTGLVGAAGMLFRRRRVEA